MNFIRKSLLLALASVWTSPALPGQGLPEGGNRINAFAVDTTTTVQEVMEKVDNVLQYSKPRFTFEEYLHILDELMDDTRYVVTTGRDFAKTISPDKVVVYLRHDVDGDPFTAVRFAREEQKRGLTGSYYILPTAAYYGIQEPHRIVRYGSMDTIYREIQNTGAEIGVHTDLLDMKIRMDIDPLVFQHEELEYWRSNGFPVVGSVAHGSGFMRIHKLNNRWIFSEFGQIGEYEYQGKRYTYGNQSVKDFGFDYEGYRNSQNKHLSDVNIRRADIFIETLRNFKPGDRVAFLTHPMHWRAESE